MASDNSMLKLPKLEKSSDYIQWQRRVKAFIREDDYNLSSVTDRPENAEDEVLQEWEAKNAKAMSTIILTLGDSVFDKTRAVVDNDERTAKDLCEELRSIYTPSNHQVTTNLFNRLNSIVFDDTKENWDKFLSKFINIIDELGSYDQGISDEEKKTKLFRTLPESFKPIAMVCNVKQMSFKDVVNAMNTEIERQNNIHNPSTSTVTAPHNNNHQKDYFTYAANNGRKRGRDGWSFTVRGGYRNNGNGRGRGRGGYQAQH